MNESQDMPIRFLQTMLRLLQVNEGQQRQVIPDGIYGQATTDAVRSFQRTHELPVTGATDLATWNAISRAYQTAMVEQSQAEPLQIVLQPQQVLKQGSQNSHLLLMQAMLATLCRYYPEMPCVRVNGAMDAQCCNCVRWLQKRFGLPVTGDIDRHTWQSLSRLYRQTVGDGSGRFPIRQAQRPSPDQP